MAEVIRVTCKNNSCAYKGVVNEYDENLRQHTAFKCGNCGHDLYGDVSDDSDVLPDLGVSQKLKDVLKVQV